MSDTIKDIFDKYSGVTFDRKFLKKVLSYVETFKRKDENTINFLGGNLIGVYTFKWVKEEQLIWIHDIMEVDDTEVLKDEIHSLDAIEPKYNVSSNVTSHSFIYCANGFLNSKSLSKRDAERGAHAAITMLQYGYLSSIHTRFFKYPANEAIAMAVYEGLSRKWGLKKYGSWGGLIEARTNSILDFKNKKNYQAQYIQDMDNDENMPRMLNDVQGRIKAVIKKLFDEYTRMRDQEARIAASGRFATMDGKQVLKESVNKYERVRERISEIIPDTHSFIKQSAIEVILKTVTTVSERQLTDVLLYLSENFEGTKKKNKAYQELVEDIIIYMFELIRKEKIKLNHIPSVMLKLRGMFRSSRVTDPMFISIRQRAGDLVEDAMPRASKSVVASTRIGVILYIALRALINN